MPVISEDNIILRIIAETQKASREIDQLDKRVDDLEGSTNKVNDQFAKLGKFARNAALVAVIAKMTQGMARFATASVKAYSEFEKTQKSFEVLVGDIGRANKLLADLRTFAKDTPFSTDEITRSAKTLLGFGRNANQVMDDIRRLGEISAATGAELTSVALVFGQVASLGKLQGQDALQFINAGVPVYDLLSRSMNKSVGELKKLQEQGKITFADLEKAIKEASEEGGAFFGAIEAQSNTIAGLTNKIAGGFQDIQIAIGEKFAPAFRSAFRLIAAIIDGVSGAVDDIETDFVFKVASALDATTDSLNAFSNVVTSWVNLNREQFKLFGIFIERLAATAKAALTGAPAERAVAEALDAAFKDQQKRTEAAQASSRAYQKIARGVFRNSYNAAMDEYKRLLEETGGTGTDDLPTVLEKVVLGDDKDRAKLAKEVGQGIEALVKAALKAYGTVYSTLLERSVRGVERTAQQSKEAKILAVFLARDLAQVTAQELRNFHQYASDELGSDNFVTLILEGYLKDAEGKEIDQDLVSRIGGKLMESINKWTEKQKTDDKKGFLQGLFGMNDKEFEGLRHASVVILDSARELTNSLVNEEIRRTDLLLQASRDRLQQLQTTAEQGNAEQLQLEEQRQRALLEKRESYLQRQRQLNAIEITLNNAVIVSNMIKGLSDAFKVGNVFGGIAYSIAAAATIASTIASVNAALSSVPAYWKGTEFVTGEGGIDNVPAMLARGERVVDKRTNTTLNQWGVKNDDLLPLVGSALGKYGPVSLHHNYGGVSNKEFRDLSSKLERVEKAIYGIQFNVNIDPDGIGVAAGNYRNRMEKRNKLLS